MEKFKKVALIITGAISVFVICTIGNVLGFISSENLIANLLCGTALLILGIGALICLALIIKNYGSILGNAYISSDRRVLAWCLRMLISIFAFSGIGLMGYVSGEFCHSFNIHLSDHIIYGFSYIMEALGMIMVGSIVIWIFAQIMNTMNKYHI